MKVSLETQQQSFQGLTIRSSVPEAIQRAIYKNLEIEKAAKDMDIFVSLDREIAGTTSLGYGPMGIPRESHTYNNYIFFKICSLTDSLAERFQDLFKPSGFRIGCDEEQKAIEAIADLKYKNFSYYTPMRDHLPY